MLTLVAASRVSRADFPGVTALGRCLRRLADYQSIAVRLTSENQRPLGAVYNEAIDAATPDDILVFVHDDVSIDDWMFSRRLDDALRQFDVVGVAGNERVQPGQVTWYLQPDPAAGPDLSKWDDIHLSGAVYHGGASGGGHLSLYGPSPRPVRLLDGLFMAARADRLLATGVRFDPALGFHFYDLDFCLSAHRAGLSIGTWPIALTHASGGGSVHSTAWSDSRRLFVRKWYS